MQRVVNKIEESALGGYTGWRKTLTSDDDVRALKVIRQELQARGFYCEIEIEHKQGLVGQYKIQRFVVKWGNEK